MDNINDQPGEYHRKHVQAALDWAETEAETRRKCGHEFIAGKLTTIAAHCRRLEQRVAELEPARRMALEYQTHIDAVIALAKRIGWTYGDFGEALRLIEARVGEGTAIQQINEQLSWKTRAESAEAALAAAQAETKQFRDFNFELADQLAAARRQLEEMGAKLEAKDAALRDGLMEFDNVWGNLMVAPAARRDGVERAIAIFRAALAPAQPEQKEGV